MCNPWRGDAVQFPLRSLFTRHRIIVQSPPLCFIWQYTGEHAKSLTRHSAPCRCTLICQLQRVSLCSSTSARVECLLGRIVMYKIARYAGKPMRMHRQAGQLEGFYSSAGTGCTESLRTVITRLDNDSRFDVVERTKRSKTLTTRITTVTHHEGETSAKILGIEPHACTL